MKSKRLIKGVLVLGIPTYVIGGFFLGSYLGKLAGNRALGIVAGISVGLVLAFYDIYLVIIVPLVGRMKK